MSSSKDLQALANQYKAITASATPAKSKYFSHAKASSVSVAYKYNPTPLTTDAMNLLKSILAASGVSSTNVTSTLRTYMDQSRILLGKTEKQMKDFGYYNMTELLAGWRKYKAANDVKGFAQFMEARDKKSGKLMSKHIPGYALDISPRSTKVESFLKSKGKSGVPGFSYVLGEPNNNCTHIEFTFLVTGKSGSAGGGGNAAAPAAPATPSASGAISASVGQGGKNIKNDVATVQTLLNKKGAKLTVDGSCGPKTIAAITAYQKQVMKMAKPDGRVDVGGATIKSLQSGAAAATPAPAAAAPKATTPAPAASTSAAKISASVGQGGKNVKADVVTVQTLLNKKGAKLTVDGSCGPKTISAITAFQKQVVKLAKPDGRIDVGGATWKALSGGTTAAAPAAAPKAPAAATPAPAASAPVTPNTKASIAGSVGQGGKNNPADIKTVKGLLVNTWKYKIAIDEKNDSNLINSIKDFQSKKVGSSNPDGRVDVGGNTWKVLTGQKTAIVSSGQKADTTKAPGKAPAATPHSEYDALAKQFGLEVATVYAIKEVESGGAGYLSDGRPKILFEGHIFWSQLQKVGINPSTKVKGNENILYSKWDKKKYVGGAGEYNRLNQAIKIHREAALKSASWGEFQIMGFNHKAAGYADVDSFVTAIQTQGSANIKSMLGFCQANNLLKHVGKGSKNWAAFAKGYNGPGYAQNKYDTKLAAAYAKYKKQYPN